MYKESNEPPALRLHLSKPFKPVNTLNNQRNDHKAPKKTALDVDGQKGLPGRKQTISVSLNAVCRRPELAMLFIILLARIIHATSTTATNYAPSRAVLARRLPPVLLVVSDPDLVNIWLPRNEDP